MSHNGASHNGVVVRRGQIVGSNTNDSAVAGNIGEVISSTIASGSAVSLTSGAAATVTSITLTPGDWDVSIIAQFNGGGTTQLAYVVATISTTNNALNNVAGHSHTEYYGNATVFGGVGNVSAPAGPARVSIATSTVYYLTVQAGFSISTCAAFGAIIARRSR